MPGFSIDVTTVGTVIAVGLVAIAAVRVAALHGRWRAVRRTRRILEASARAPLDG